MFSRGRIALRTAIFGLLAWRMAQVAAVLLVVPLNGLLEGNVYSLLLLPAAAVALYLTWIALEETAAGLKSRR